MITVGSSVIGIKYDRGVIIAADNLVSYGSLARYQNMQRVYKINDKVIVGVGGDFADYQFIKRHIDQLVINDEALGDKNELKPKALYTYLTRVFYNRRSRMNPLYLDIVVGGIQDGEPFLGHVNVRGKAYLSNCIGTGFGNHLAIPLFREYVENPNIVIDKSKAEELVSCLNVLLRLESMISKAILLTPFNTPLMSKRARIPWRKYFRSARVWNGMELD